MRLVYKSNDRIRVMVSGLGRSRYEICVKFETVVAGGRHLTCEGRGEGGYYAGVWLV